MSTFTINACNRCRKRKSKCDAGIPTCVPCRDSGSTCEWTDPRTKVTLSRRRIIELEDELTRLERQLDNLRSGGPSNTLLSNNGDALPSIPGPVPSLSSPAQDRSPHGAGELTHFLGASSGIQLARSLLESTRSDYVDCTDDLLPDASPSTFRSIEQPTPPSTWDTTPLSTNLRPALPSLETTMGLIDMFFDQYLVQYPILIPTEFKRQVVDLYERSQRSSIEDKDPCLQFMLYMVLSISLSHVNGHSPEAKLQAKAFSSSSMARLGSIMRIKSAQSLQCLLLLLLSALVNATSAPIWSISGLCIRMVIDLGYHSERTICVGATEQEIELKRRLFWVSYTLDRSLATILGRPFTLSDEIIDVGLPYASLPEDVRPHILQWLHLQQLQSQAVSRLYMVPHSVFGTMADTQWMPQMRSDIDMWLEQATSLPLLKHWNPDRWRYWYFTFLLLLHRPSPMSRKMDTHEYITAFHSAKNMVHISFIRNNQLPHDLDCVELHSQVLSGIILLFLVLKSAEVRVIARDAWLGYKSCLMQWRYNMGRQTHRWENMVRTQSVMARLADAAVAIVEKQATGGTGRVAQSTTEGQALFKVPDTHSFGQSSVVPGPPGADRGLPWNTPLHGSTNALSNSDGGLGMSILAMSAAQTQPSANTSYTFPEPWNDTSAPNNGNEDNAATGFQEGSDLSMMLNHDIWSGLDFADGNLSILDFLQYPLAGSETLGLSLNPVELSSMEGGLTDSMLNFREDQAGA